MGFISVSFLCAVIAAMALSLLKGWRHPSFRMALMLGAFWVISNTSDSWMDPLMDTAGWYAVWFTILKQPQTVRRPIWLHVLLACFTAQLVTHVAFIGGSQWWRQLALNAFNALQLLAVATPGGIDVARYSRELAGRCRDWCVHRGAAWARSVCSRLLGRKVGAAGGAES